MVDFSSSQKDASGAETPTTDQQVDLPKIPNASTEARLAITQECACSSAFKKCISSPKYQCQDINLKDEYPFDGEYDVCTHEEESGEEKSDTEPITVLLGTLTSKKRQQTQEIWLIPLTVIQTRSTPSQDQWTPQHELESRYWSRCLHKAQS